MERKYQDSTVISVLNLIEQGLGRKEIARKLGFEFKDVSYMIERIRGVQELKTRYDIAMNKKKQANNVKLAEKYGVSGKIDAKKEIIHKIILLSQNYPLKEITEKMEYSSVGALRYYINGMSREEHDRYREAIRIRTNRVNRERKLAKKSTTFRMKIASQEEPKKNLLLHEAKSKEDDMDR